MLRLAIDIGGTFTDVVMEDAAGFQSTKVLTSGDSPETAASQGVLKLLRQTSRCHADITSVVHGTTLATNALIERRGAKTAFITTAGFRDVLEMRYEKRFEQYALDIQMPEPLVPRPLRFGLEERILADGSVLRAPDNEQIDAICDELIAQQVEAVAIGFLHAYRNPAHETAVAARMQERLGNAITVCQSAEVAGEIREYERFSTVCANAYVRPLMTRYLDKLKSHLVDEGFNGSFLMMLSDGALTTLDNATRFPIRLVEGGPAGGVALGAYVAQELKSARTLSLDIGGTTAKMCFINDGKPQTTRLFEVARAWRDTKGSGLPVKVPTVELIEIGAGGGSIAQVDTMGRLTAGPRSAGSRPGPAAYNLGGKSATITDAHLVIGNLSADGFAAGMIEIKPELANQSVKADVQQPLDFATTEQAASGIVELADETMANAARVHAVELGLDVSRYDLLVSGGAGGLHAVRIADKLGINKIIVPAFSGVGSAVGFLRSQIAFETAITVLEPIDTVDTVKLKQRLQNALTYVGEIVSGAATRGHIQTQVIAELRYAGQGLEFRFTLDAQLNLSDALPALIETFEAHYQATYGYVLSDIAIELVSLSVSAFEQTNNDTNAAPAQAHPATNHSISRTHRLYDRQKQASFNVPVHTRDTISDVPMQGPMIIPEAQTTTVLSADWQVQATQHGHLVLKRAG